MSDVPSVVSFTLPAAVSSGTIAYDTLQVRYQNETDRQIYGNYYNWYTATARTGTQSTAFNVDATGSICPKGMNLPSNTGNGSFNALTTTYGIGGNATGATKLQSIPFSFSLAGYFNGSWSSQGSYGLYWSRTSDGSSRTYSLIFLASSVSTQERYDQSYGLSVRCVTPSTIQGNITSWCSAQTTPAAFTSGTTINANVPETEMVDARDGERYKIRKLADGHCWMTENLRLGKNDKTYTLTPADSNVSSNYTLPHGSTNNWGTGYNVEGIYVRNDRETTNYGNLYTWQTATAGTGSSYTTANQNVPSSICPLGMALPSSGIYQAGAGGFPYIFITTYGVAPNITSSEKLQAAPFEYELAGRYYNGSLGVAGSTGNYWSRTASYSSSNAYMLHFSDSSITSPATTTSDFRRSYGLSIRCVTL